MDMIRGILKLFQMKNKRVQALLAPLEQVRIELGAEFKFMETTCDDQLKELKQLRFEAMGNSPQEDLFETRVITYEALNEILSNEVTNPAVSKAILDHFDALTLKGSLLNGFNHEIGRRIAADNFKTFNCARRRSLAINGQ